MNRVWVRFGPPLVALRGVAGSRALRRTSIAFLIFSGAEAASEANRDLAGVIISLL